MAITYEEFMLYPVLLVVVTAVISIVIFLRSGSKQWTNERYYRGALANSAGIVFLGLSSAIKESRWLDWLFLMTAFVFITTGWVFMWKGRSR